MWGRPSLASEVGRDFVDFFTKSGPDGPEVAAQEMALFPDLAGFFGTWRFFGPKSDFLDPPKKSVFGAFFPDFGQVAIFWPPGDFFGPGPIFWTPPKNRVRARFFHFSKKSGNFRIF